MKPLLPMLGTQRRQGLCGHFDFLSMPRPPKTAGVMKPFLPTLGTPRRQGLCRHLDFLPTPLFSFASLHAVVDTRTVAFFKKKRKTIWNCFCLACPLF